MVFSFPLPSYDSPMTVKENPAELTNLLDNPVTSMSKREVTSKHINLYLIFSS